VTIGYSINKPKDFHPNWPNGLYQEFFVVFVYSDGLKLGPHGYMRKGGIAGTSELLYLNCVWGT
jgi:hypothetical protein